MVERSMTVLMIYWTSDHHHCSTQQLGHNAVASKVSQRLRISGKCCFYHVLKPMWHAWRINRAAECEDHLLPDSAYLQHDRADVSYTLSDGLWSAGDGDSPLCGVRQHVSCHLNLSACGLHIARQRRNKGCLVLKRAYDQPNSNAASSTPKLPRTHFDMQGAAASQIAMCAPIFEEVHTNIVHSEWVFSLRRSLQA